jgi:PhnB protein
MTKKYELNPYLYFDGRCAEAIEFYRKAVDAEPMMVMQYKDAPPEAKAQGCGSMDPNKVMHATLNIGGSRLQMSDGPCTGKFDGFSLGVTVAGAADAERIFKALSDGGKVDMPLTKTFFSPAFGMLTDRFGVKWMVHVGQS